MINQTGSQSFSLSHPLSHPLLETAADGLPLVFVEFEVTALKPNIKKSVHINGWAEMVK